MKFTLKRNKITLSEVPQRDVPGALLILDKELKASFIDVNREQRTYLLPNEMKARNIASIYLRIY